MYVGFFNRAFLSRVELLFELRFYGWLLCGSRFFTLSGAIGLAHMLWSEGHR